MVVVVVVVVVVVISFLSRKSSIGNASHKSLRTRRFPRAITQRQHRGHCAVLVSRSAKNKTKNYAIAAMNW